MFISANGVLFEQTSDNGIKPSGDFHIDVSVDVSCDGVVAKDSGPMLIDVSVDTTAAMTVTYSPEQMLIDVDVDPYMNGFIPRTVPQTAKFSPYTVRPAYRTHTEYASDNLLSQFQGLPNIESLLEGVLDELDKSQTDAYEFQDLIFNIEKAEGVNLDICGAIVGLKRFVGQTDLVYRNQIYTQIFANICDGTMARVLSALLTNYNLEPSISSRVTLQLKTLSNNTLEVYVRDHDLVTVWRGSDFVQSLMPAGAKAMIVVNDRDMELGNYFSWDSVEGDNDPFGAGFGSVEDDSVGGEATGLYNYETYTDYTGQASEAPLKTTTKTIPVDTFGS